MSQRVGSLETEKWKMRICFPMTQMTWKSIQVVEVEVTFMEKSVYEVVIMINTSSIHVSKPSLWFEDGMEVSEM